MSLQSDTNNDIFIIPSQSLIQFSGSAANPITLLVEPSGAVNFVGTTGSILKIMDNLSGSLFSVNNISGLSILEVFSNNQIKMGNPSNYALIVSGSNVIITGSLVDKSSGVKFLVVDTATGVVYTTGSGGGGGGGSGSTSPGGNPTQIQYNSASAFGGVPVLTYDGTTLVGTGSFTGSFTGSLLGTSSWASQSVSASYVNLVPGPRIQAINYSGSVISITGSIGGLDTQIQFNSGSAFSGSANLSYRYITNGFQQGEGVIATGSFSHAQGSFTLASGPHSHAEGNQTTASGQYSHAEGNQTRATNTGAHAEGDATIASGSYSHAEGNQTSATNTGAHAEGQFTLASNIYAHSEGVLTTASAQWSHAEGSGSRATGQYSHAEGEGTQAITTGTHAEGQYTTASAVNSHTEGRNTKTLVGAAASHAEGELSTAGASYSHAEGINSFTGGQYSHAEGRLTRTDGLYSHAEGNQASASGDSSHAEGVLTRAFGEGSHAEGSGSVAFGTASHAEGLGTIASGNFQHVQGQFNLPITANSTFIIGNGTSVSARSNLVFASGSQFQITGSARVTGSVIITGSLDGYRDGNSFYGPTFTNPTNGTAVETGIALYGGSGVDGTFIYITSTPRQYTSNTAYAGSTLFATAVTDLTGSLARPLKQMYAIVGTTATNNSFEWHSNVSYRLPNDGTSLKAKLDVPSGNFMVSGSVNIASDSTYNNNNANHDALYFGNPGQAGSWRIALSGSSLVVDKWFGSSYSRSATFT
jgi:hypothetical protein